MSISVFLSHTSVDKPFVRKLARDFENHGINFWLDERDIKIGQSLIDKIREGLDEVNYVAVILSPASVNSSWVQREIDVAMNQEIQGKTVKILPIMYKHCNPPGFLFGKLYADFTEESNYPNAFRKLVESMGIVFNKKALEPTFDGSTLWSAIDHAVNLNLRILSHPFHRPFRYIGMSVPNAAKEVGQAPIEVGNIIVDNEDCHMLLEAEGNFISYVEVEFKKTAPCHSNQEFVSEPLLGALSINPVELDLVRKQTHCHTYYDHRKKLKVNVLCTYEGGPLSVSFSAKYYGM